MAGPWEKYTAPPAAGPWAKYQASAPQADAPESDASKDLRANLSMRTQNPSYAQYADLPEWQKPIVAAGDILSQAVDIPTFGMKEEIAAGIRAPFTNKTFAEELNEQERQSNAASKRSGWAGTAAQLAGGIGSGLALANSGLSLGANAAARGSGLGKIAAGSAVDGGLTGLLYGAGQEGDLKDRAWNAAVGGGAGAITGYVLPLATTALSNLARRAVSPFAASPNAERQAAISVLEHEGVPLTAGQRIGSNSLQYAESEIGGKRAAQMIEDQGRAFTDAAMRRAGAAGLADPDNLAANSARLSRGFEDVSARNALRADPQFVTDIKNTLGRYEKLLETQQRPVVRDLATDIIGRLSAGGGRMSGQEYQIIRSDLGKAAKGASNENLGAALRGLRNALDNAMDRSINPSDKGVWQTLRRQYGNQKTLERAIANAGGEDAAIGVISPARLRMAAAGGKNAGSYARGEGDFAKLARAGQAVMTPLPNSGTPARLGARNLGAGLMSILGAGAGASTGLGPLGAMLGTAVGAAAPRVAGAAMMTGPVQRYLTNQVAAGTADIATQELLARLLRSGGVPALIDARN